MRPHPLSSSFCHVCLAESAFIKRVVITCHLKQIQSVSAFLSALPCSLMQKTMSRREAGEAGWLGALPAALTPCLLQPPGRAEPGAQTHRQGCDARPTRTSRLLLLGSDQVTLSD